MIIPERVVDLATDKKYQIDRENLLGQGATGAVYAVKGAERDAIVVKIALPDLSAATLADFVAEQKILADLESTTHTPWAHVGQALGDPECKIILLERVKPNQQLVQIARQASTGVLPEELVLQVGLQYAELLDTLHRELKRTMRGDRKVGDLYWDESKQRLIVLDWNRALPMPQEEKDCALLVRQDLRIFGQLWAQLAMESAAASFADPFDDTNPAWQHLSLGTRTLIFKTLNSHTVQGFADALIFKNAVMQQWNDFQRAQNQAKDLLTDALGRKKRADEESSLAARADLASQVRVLVDLVRRYPPRLSDKQAKELDALETWAKESEQKEIEHLRAITRQLHQKIRNRSFSEAASFAASEMRNAEALALMALRRWQYLARWAWQGNQNGLVVEETARAIAEALDPFEQQLGVAHRLTFQEARAKRQSIANLSDTIQAAQHVLADINGVENKPRELPEAVTREIKPLELELQIWENWLADKRADAATQWDELRQVAQDQADDLRQLVLSSLGFDDYIRRGDQERALKQYATEFMRQTDEIFGLLVSADQWLNLSSQLDEAIRYYATHLQNRPGVAPEIKQDYNLLLELQELNRDCAPSLDLRDQAHALEYLQQIVFAPHHATLKETLHRQITTSAIVHAEKLVQSEWLDELEKGKRLFDVIRDFGEPYVRENNEARLARIETRFTEWQRLHDELEEFTIEQLLGDPDSKYDEILNRAAQMRVQLFDRRALTMDQVEQSRVSVIRSVREAKRMEQQMSDLASQLRDVADKLAQHQTKLDGDLETVKGKFTEAEKWLATTYDQIEKDRQERLARIVSAGETLKRDLQEYKTRIDHTHKATIVAMSNFEKQFDNLRVQGLTQQFEEADAVIQRADKIGDKLASIQIAQIPVLAEQLGKMENMTADTNRVIQSVRDDIDKLGDERIVQARQVSATAQLTRDQILLIHFVNAGLAAAREFDFAKSNMYFSYIKEENAASTTSEQNLIDHLSDTVQWLNRCDKEDGCLESLRTWKKALADWKGSIVQPDETQVAQVQVSQQKAIALVSPEDRHFWLIAELEEQQWFLERKTYTSQTEEDVQLFVDECAKSLREFKNQLELPEPSPDKVSDRLEKQIFKYANKPNLTILEREAVHRWIAWFTELGEVWEKIEGVVGNNNINLERVQALTTLTEILNQTSNEIFYIVCEEWNRKIERYCAKNQNSQTQFDEAGKWKAYLGRQSLMMYSHLK